MEDGVQDLAGKRIIVGGAATGIGAGLALKLVKCGARVIVGDVNEAGLRELQPELEREAGTAVPMVFDLADDESIARLVARCLEEFGGIDGLAIPGADTSRATMSRDNTIFDMDPKIWERTIRVNAIGHGMLMKAAIPHMIANGGGSIVSVTSSASYLGMKYVPAYASSKAALNALVRHVANVCGKDNIRCNAVCPGRVVNDRKDDVAREEVVNVPPTNAFLRFGEPKDVASVLAFLLSDESAWITGQVISTGGAAFRE